MGWQLDTSSPIFQQMSQQQQQAYIKQFGNNIYDNEPSVPIGLQQEGADLQTTNAALPGVGAKSKTDVIQSQQAAAPQNLQHELKNGMTLHSAISKYKALGMSADDIFNSYLSQSPYGTPHESPTELKNLGVTDAALGEAGKNGDFLDRWNVQQGILGLRKLQDEFHSTNAFDQLKNTLGLPGQGGNIAAGYNGRRALYTEHLNTLIPGGSNASGQIDKVASAIPNISDPREYAPGKADQQFADAEDALLNAKGYKYKDLGLNPQKTKPISSGDVLAGLINDTFVKPITDAVGANADVVKKTMSDVNQNNAGVKKGDILGSILAAGKDTYALGRNELGAVLPDIGAISEIEGGRNPKAFVKGSVGSAKNVLNMITGGGEKVAADSIEGLPGALKTFFRPKGAVSQAGNVRDAGVVAAKNAGEAVNGTRVFNDFKDWSQQAKMGNLGQGDAIDQAVAEAKSIFKGKQIDPQKALEAYNQADNGFTKTGLPKSPVQFNIDRGLRDILSKHLEEIVPGWKESTAAMRKAYNMQDSGLRKGAITATKYALPLGFAGAGGEVLHHILFGEK